LKINNILVLNNILLQTFIEKKTLGYRKKLVYDMS